MIAFALVALASIRDTPWPVATRDNGMACYLAAGHLVDSPEWKPFDNAPPEKKKLDVLRREASHADPILILIKKGNALPVYDPIKVETFASLHPEYASFKRICRIARDVGYMKALEGDPGSATQWLVQTDRFAYRLPTPNMLPVVVKTQYIGLLRDTARRLLPRLGAPELKELTTELREISERPSDAAAAARGALEILDRSIADIVNDPGSLGLPDMQPDITGSFANLFAIPDDPRVYKIATKILSSAPAGTQNDPKAMVSYLASAESQVPAAVIVGYRKLIDTMRSALNPANYSLSDYAKNLDAESKAHAVMVVRLGCEPSAKSLIGAFQRPERTWWEPWTPPATTSLTEQVSEDAKHLRFARLDFFALQIVDGINKLSSGGGDAGTYLCRSLFLEREKNRLALIDAEIWSYQLAHRRLPSSLKEIGSPDDPLSNRPYWYRRDSATTYDLAAVGIPGIARIDAATRLPKG